MSTRFLPYISAAAAALAERKEEVNRLNVFPVPDGDTGTNMSLTMDTVVKEVAALPATATLADVCKAVTHGSLMGARGNSGVITSQILRGICDGIKDADEFSTKVIDDGMTKAVEIAFKAVRKPVEGTILTVLRDSADAAHEALAQDLEPHEALKYITAEAFESVKRTPELLPVLKENGVVDSGAFGLAILFQGFTDAVTGSTDLAAAVLDTVKPVAAPKVAIEQINDWAGSKYLYCTEFLVHSDQVDKDETLKFLGTMGDCELIVGERPDYKVHVHSNTPGTVLSYFTDRGQIAEVHVHNMKLQADDRTDGIAAEEQAPAAPAPAEPSERKPVGFVAVSVGEGVERIFESLGVDVIVSGGQTMNPPTSELLEAVEKVNADAVVLLPNNKNIIMTANTAAELAECDLRVVPTKSVTQGFAALAAIDPELSIDELVGEMAEAAGAVRYGEVTTAIKDAKSSKGESIHDGDVIGIANDSLDVVGETVEDVVLALLDELVDDDADIITVLAGCDMDDDRFDALVEAIEDRFDELEVDSQRGEQPVYPVILSVE